MKRSASRRRCFDSANKVGTTTFVAGILHKPGWRLWLSGLLFTIAILPLTAQTRQNPSPMTDTTRPHPRIAQAETPGRRVDLQTLKGAVLFAGPKVKADKPVPLVIHFHGAPWLIQFHIAKALPHAALITVQLGARSRVYGDAFKQAEAFQSLIDEAGRELGIKRGWSSITLTGFSAGYGAVRAILRHEKNFAMVNNVLLLDGIHAGLPDGKPLADGGMLNTEDLDSFVRFARKAVAGRKAFVITHSEIFPGTFASTTECVDYLLSELALKRRPELKQGPMGMQQLSAVNSKGFRVLGYAGNTAPDHIDNLHAMSAWFTLLNIK